MQTSFAKVGDHPDPKIWESPSRKRKHGQDNYSKQPSITEKSLQYFKVVECTKDKLSCKCLLCGEHTKPVNGTKASNLASHLKSVHPNIFAERIADKIKEPLPVKRLRLLQNAVEIVGVNGRPFSSLCDSGYQAGIKNKLDKLRNAGIGISFSNENMPEVKQHLKTMAGEVRNEIRRELDGRFVCIMVDLCSKNHRKSIMGISAQFIKDSKVTIRSLGMLLMKRSHTSEYLCEVLRNCLADFGIEKWQVLCITTDNGANVVKMVIDYDQVFSNPRESNGDTTALNMQASRTLIHEFNEVNDAQTDREIQLILDEPEQITEEEALDILFSEEELEEYRARLLEATNQLADETTWKTDGVYCVAHTGQLVVKDGLKRLQKRHLNVIGLANRVVKFLRLESTCIIAKESGFKYNLPRIDCKTRWGSTCAMVSYFI